MNGYLGLIPASAKAHRRQNRMTVLCIVFSVFLVTGVFSMADLGVRMETGRLLNKHGTQALLEIARSESAQTLFSMAAALFVIILLSGVLMIASSIHSNVAERTQFFGMMRCIGMSKKQVARYVRLEALYWCKLAIPAGILSGVLATWGLCAALRFLVGEEFLNIPVFGVSPVGILSGVIMGVVSVLIAAASPERRAARVSPVMALSGNNANEKTFSHAANIRMAKVDSALGIHHAVSAKKNFLLMTGSFALSIILFLSFCVLIDLVSCMMPQYSNASDVSITSCDGANSIDGELLAQLRAISGVKRVFARRSRLGLPALATGESAAIDLVSYDDFDLDCLTTDRQLCRGSQIQKVYGNSRYALAVQDAYGAPAIGDTVMAGGEAITVAGVFKRNPFSGDGSADERITLVTSDETFMRLTGETGYALVLLQLTKDATDQTLAAIRPVSASDGELHDEREMKTANTYIAFRLFIFGFLAVIALVSVLNIKNNISMSVFARSRQYGIMRAIGMDARQMTKMIAAEALTYATSGCLAGTAIGLLLSKRMFTGLITSHYSNVTWRVPVIPLAIILLFMTVSVLTAIGTPAKRIARMSVTEAINTL